MWIKFGAEIVPIPSGRAKVNFYLSKTHLEKNYQKSLMLPLGLPLKETIEQTAKVAYDVENDNDFDCVIVNVGSGTIAAGIVQGMSNTIVYGIMGRTGSVELKEKQILGKANSVQGGFFGSKRLILVDPGYQYTEPAQDSAPFPTHPYYDLKAWSWLKNNIHLFEDKKVLFWNIGS
jgi:1-aminocyclopropane-1-carboxylate deaminase/D-cysteine desulfhydrase-like pyridoxal-dependent ACC family enzyme